MNSEDPFKGPFSESPDRYGSQGAVTLTIMFSGGGLVEPVGATDRYSVFLVALKY